MRQARLNYESNLIANIKSRTHSFYSYRFNVKKSKCLSIGPQLITTSYTIVDEDNTSHSLSSTDCEKDSGAWVSSTLHPSIQYQKSYAKAMQSLDILLDRHLNI